MAGERLRYDRMVERALRSVVRESLAQVAADGLPGDHHFYLTFATKYPGVMLPDYLKSQYPQEMTIVIQYQYYDLTVDDESFSVTLSFNNKQERLSIPLGAISTFADPSVNFALQFQTLPTQDRGGGDDETDQPPTDKDASPEGEGDGDGDGGDNVVTLDSFRKK